MRFLIFQHTPEENPGSLVEWIASRGHSLTVHHWYLDSDAPADADFLVVLGGPMNVDEVDAHPWLLPEKAALAAWITSGKPVLGICLGGQMLAQALGAKVGKSEEREIGFCKLQRGPGVHPAFAHWPLASLVYQFHEDVFSLPPGAERLALSEACANQAFSVGLKLVGLQFHPESTATWVQANRSAVEPRPGERFVQHPDLTEKEMAAVLPVMQAQFFRLLDDFVESL